MSTRADASPGLPADELLFAEATTLAGWLRSGRLGAEELMHQTLERIERVNPVLNAICTLDAEGALAAARRADSMRARGEPLGALHGLPIAVKDLAPTRGMRTTRGSLAFEHWVPELDALFVERLREAGAIIIGKTNTPELGAGSQTFNAVFGVTRNPWDPSRTPGGSSGGAAAAVASGMLPLADGTDMGGSLRNPAAFCHVVGFRTSPGRVPMWPKPALFDPLGVAGPIARHVRDAALLLSVMAGPDPRAALALELPGETFAEPASRDWKGCRIAWSPDLGRYPVEPEIVEACQRSLAHFEALGCRIEEAAPDLQDADEVFQTLRALSFATAWGSLLPEHRERLKETVVWNIEKGLELRAEEVIRAERARTRIFERVSEFFGRYAFLLCPTTQVPPFPTELEWVREVAGVPMQTYIDWMGLCYAITVTTAPAISVPAGLTARGLPVGLQIVGPPRADRRVLELAAAFEQVSEFWRRRPPALPPAAT